MSLESQPRRPPATPSWLIALGVLACLGLVVGAIALTVGSFVKPTGKKLAYPGGSLTVSVPPEEMKIAWSNKRRFIVRIDRKNFRGEVRLSMVDLPEGLRAEPVVAKDHEVEVELFVIASFQGPVGEVKARIVGQAEELRAETPVTIIVSKQ